MPTNLPECPYCGAKDEMWWLKRSPPVVGTVHWGAVCGACNKEYIVNLTMTLSFTTDTYT